MLYKKVLRNKVHALAAGIVLGFFLGQPALAEDKAATAQQALAKAEAALADATSAGAVWRLIDKSTGSGAVNLDKLLGAAKKKQEAGELDEAIRIANRISEAAMLGIEQIESQKGKAQPFYN